MAYLAASASHVKLMDGRRSHTHGLAELPNQPARVITLIGVAKNGEASQGVHRRRSEHGVATDRYLAVVDRNGRAEERGQHGG